MLREPQELGKIAREHNIDVLLVVFNEAEEPNGSKTGKDRFGCELAVQVSRELLMPIGIILPSTPHDESAWLFDNVYCFDDKDGEVTFIDKPNKARKSTFNER